MLIYCIYMDLPAVCYLSLCSLVREVNSVWFVSSTVQSWFVLEAVGWHWPNISKVTTPAEVWIACTSLQKILVISLLNIPSFTNIKTIRLSGCHVVFVVFHEHSSSTNPDSFCLCVYLQKIRKTSCPVRCCGCNCMLCMHCIVDMIICLSLSSIGVYVWLQLKVDRIRSCWNDLFYQKELHSQEWISCHEEGHQLQVLKVSLSDVHRNSSHL